MSSQSHRYQQLTEAIIGCGITVHAETGPGLLESIYTPCLILELRAQGLQVDTERTIPVVYRQVRVAHFRVDLVVEDLIVIEVKAVKALDAVHQAQLITYLKLTGCPAGLLMNFNAALLTNGIKKVVHPDLYREDQQTSPKSKDIVLVPPVRFA
jgi:GxxExxY protein